MKGRALRRALETKDGFRVFADVPAITDTTELITPEIAQKYLEKNKHNRPVNWRRVEQYTGIMERGEWKLTPQGIIFDAEGDLVNGQNRLWAVIYSGISIYMRVSRGMKPDTATVIDRGMPQSARDLAARVTERRHSPLEASLARAIIAAQGRVNPSVDELATYIEKFSAMFLSLLPLTKGIKKNKAMIMVMAAICVTAGNEAEANILMKRLETFVDRLIMELQPISVDRCWGRGAAFLLAMEKAKLVIGEAR